MTPPHNRPSLAPSYPLSSRETSRVMPGAESPEPHLGWRSRGYLPHWDHPGMIQSLNFRLGDPLPAKVLDAWRMELQQCPDDRRSVELRRRIEEYLDAGHG